MKKDTDDHRSAVRVWRIAILIMPVLVTVGCRWINARQWTVSSADGRSTCRVQAGWTEQEVARHCGAPSGRGSRPKVPAAAPGVDVRMCSATGDVYGEKVVLYGCDGKVETVERMPAQGFIYPSN